MRTILMAEDNDEDFLAFQRVLSRNNGVTLIRCRDGEEVLDYLTNILKERYSWPSLILLDLNMPGTDGRETLARLKSDPTLRSIPAVIFSTSLSPQDVIYCYDHGASGYMNKPVNYAEFERMVRSLLDYWKHTMLLPASTHFGTI